MRRILIWLASTVTVVVLLFGYHTSTSVLGPAAGGMPEQIALQRWIPDIAEREVFLCGPTTWTDSFQQLALTAGVPADRIHTESFGW